VDRAVPPVSCATRAPTCSLGLRPQIGSSPCAFASYRANRRIIASRFPAPAKFVIRRDAQELRRAPGTSIARLG
jgi:hypothetical protein